jgi:EmrB/QacA subfamily drug resistance transporter
MIGLVGFSAFSLLCGFAVSDGMLITARALQGAAAALLAPSVFSITAVTFEEGAERNKALGILGAIAGSGAAIGVLLGGVLTQYVGWEWIFYVNAPIGILALLLALRYVAESRLDGVERHFDTAGAVSVTASLMLLVYGLTQAPNKGWGSIETLGVLIGSAVLMALFLVVESRARWPLVRLGFFRQRTPTAANLVGLGLGTMTFGMFFLLSLYMQQVLGFSAIKTGVGYLAVALTAVFASGAAQALVTRIGVKPVLTTGLGLIAGGLVLFTQISVDGTYAGDLLAGFLMLGVGLGFSFVPISIAALSVQPRDAGLASGLINTSQQIGGALGVAILTTVATTRTENQLAGGAGQPDALTAGFSLAFWVAFGFAALSILATLLAIRRADLRAEVAPVAA